jgi:hypothetical protein
MLGTQYVVDSLVEEHHVTHAVVGSIMVHVLHHKTRGQAVFYGIVAHLPAGHEHDVDVFQTPPPGAVAGYLDIAIVTDTGAGAMTLFPTPALALVLASANPGTH